MVMQEVSVERAKQIAEGKGLRPGRVKGTSGIQFTRGSNARLEIIDWNDFERIIHDGDLAIYESSGWMKIMKRR